MSFGNTKTTTLVPSLAPSASQQSTSSTSSNLPNIPFSRLLSPIDHKNMKFLVLDCPTESTIHQYVKELKTRGVTDVVRVCEPTYNKEVFEQVGIHVHDWPFKDGGIPPSELVIEFLQLCDERFVGGICTSKDDLAKDSMPVIAVHCVAGLGRAPVLVAIALIEAGMVPLDAIEFVRKRRRGAFNSVQLQYLLEGYKKHWNKKQNKLFAKKRGNSPNINSKEEEPVNDHSSGISIFGKFLRFKKSSPSSVA